MGTRNWQLIRDFEAAKKTGRPTEDVNRLAGLVEESQQACPHPKEQVQIAILPKDVETTYRGLMKQGDQTMQCLACSRHLRHYPKA